LKIKIGLSLQENKINSLSILTSKLIPLAGGQGETGDGVVAFFFSIASL